MRAGRAVGILTIARDFAAREWPGDLRLPTLR